ncbi:cyclic AMP response element-binding protein B isoform X4 [Scaptodrosophila lebanonensis]|uniref:Cyclic AMP response element-binding protein B isoform X4 n=1 Tax=Drosophila lebanonensis TaxID=7225 RepID=A0A6J2TWI1_DROLE|nr:cyclic AMP response element-binding protein B isoform X4 [Scaptodrosophila lebanonensis]
MDSIVEENGNSASSGNVNDVVDVSAAVAAAAGLTSGATGGQQQQQNQQSTTGGVSASSNTNNTGGGGGGGPSVLTTTANCNIQYPIPALAQHTGIQAQSVIQAANHSSVIQTAAATNQQALATASAMHKAGGGGGNVVYVTKPPNTTVIHTTASNAVQIPPNFPCKIKPEPNTQHPEDSDDSLSDEDSPHHRSELTRRPSYNKIFTEISGPDISDNSGIAEDQTRKREIRLQKNREAARECRRKKKEYIKCLENRVAVLENQNKALIEELKSLKELYCQTKND